LYVFLAILIGFLASVLAGMFGVGGAGLTTPALRVILDATPGIALGTTLPVVIPTSLAAGYTYYRSGFVDVRIAVACGAGGIFGSVGGALLTKYLNLHYLMLLTGVVVLYLGTTTFIRGVRGKVPEVVEAEGADGVSGPTPLPVPEPEDSGASGGGFRNATITYVAIGLVGGFFSGLLGLGGGIVLIPAFLYILRLPIKKAFGTSLAVIAIIAIPGTVVHALLGHISGWLFLYLVVGVIPGAYLGARLAIKAREPVLYTGFGVLVVIFGIIFIVNEIIRI
jgi:uncharacterized membrane protein YfcA